MRRERALLRPLVLLLSLALALCGAAFIGGSAAASDAGRVTGDVLGTGFAPLADVDVRAYVHDGTSWVFAAESTTTESDGTYDLDLPAGTYRLEFHDRKAVYASQFYPNATNVAAATDITVAADGTLDNVDVQLTVGGHITGTVTDTGGTPLSYVIGISAYRNDGDGWDYVDSGVPGEDGTYDISPLPTGTYRLQLYNLWGGGYLTDYYNHAATIETAEDISVTVGATTGGKDVQLTLGGNITGTVTGTGGTGLVGYEINAFRDDGEGWRHVGTTYSGEDGNYDLVGLPTGTYRLGFMVWPTPHGYVSEYYSDAVELKDANDISVTVGTTTSGKNAELTLGGSISGTVVGTGSALTDVWVEAYRYDGAHWDGIRWGSLDSDGGYELSNLPAGTYRIGFSDDEEHYATQYWDNAPTLTTATDIVVDAGAAVAGKDAQLSVDPPTTTVSNTALPTISKAPKVGAAVAAKPGTWNPAGAKVTYQWLVAGKAISGATTASYAPVARDLGKSLQVRVTATAPGHEPATATSAPSTIGKGTLKAVTKPKVTGKAKQNATLTVFPGTWSPKATTKIQWYAGAKAIPKATATKLKLAGTTLKAVAGKPISVLLTVTAPGYTTVVTTLKVPGKV